MLEYYSAQPKSCWVHKPADHEQRVAGVHTHAPAAIIHDTAHNSIMTTGARQRAPIKSYHLNAKTILIINSHGNVVGKH